MRPLTATYRLQLHAGFRLADALAHLPWVDELGISHLYLSPLLRARAGSPHGYDVIDPTRIDPDRGSEEDLWRLADAAHARGMGLVLDVVPNHVAASEECPAWRDLLRRGREAPHARWFDVDFEAAGGRVVLPVLGAPLDDVLARGELVPGEEEGEPVLRYFDRWFPLAPGTAAAGDLPAVLRRQHYELVFWRDGARRLNYRRFFEIDELAGVRVEDPAVFEETHAHVLGWVSAGLVDGLRVDHVDGLRLPGAYLRRLRAALDAARPEGPRATLHVEKILARDERLPADWPVDGTTGYDFLAAAEDVLLDPDGLRGVEAVHRGATGLRLSMAEVERRGKREALTRLLAADLRRVADVGARAARADPDAPPAARDRRALRAALVESVAHLGVYRTYLGEDLRPSPDDVARLEAALAGARAALGEGQAGAALAWLGRVLLHPRRPVVDDERELVLRWQQLSGPATAKGVEDTAFYRHVPLAARNEVGADPAHPPGRAVERFHAAARERLTRWPRSLLAGSTHDTKRSADLRARLAALTADPEGWRAAVTRWQRRARPFETRAGSDHRARGVPRLPDGATRYLLYQTLLGAWPLVPPETETAALVPALAELTERVEAALVKSAREAKEVTSWADPDRAFEEALRRYVRGVLDPRRAPELLEDLDRAARALARAGVRVALARLVLQLTAPGVPDVYRGEETWSFRLVDPDNRAPVDFARLRALAAGLPGPEADAAAVAELATRPEDGRLKLHVLRALLRDRREHPATYLEGPHEPLEARGPRADDLVAYRRGSGRASRCVLVVRRPPRPWSEPEDPAAEEAAWRATQVRLPADVPSELRCLLGATTPATSGAAVVAADALGALPACVLAPRDG